MDAMAVQYARELCLWPSLSASGGPHLQVDRIAVVTLNNHLEIDL